MAEVTIKSKITAVAYTITCVLGKFVFGGSSNVAAGNTSSVMSKIASPYETCMKAAMAKARMIKKETLRNLVVGKCLCCVL